MSTLKMIPLTMHHYAKFDYNTPLKTKRNDLLERRDKYMTIISPGSNIKI